ncbi:T9SS type A sorting domain-containing protein [Pontibacter beigongshangensis]|uniref:T9SS type A sorting domain-containing protein n=1 Tax=Pontibacter beigongshangensis TaxID=2574733 RepID=UPI001650078D|nr:T9SS type A sorting domain-containing protein [Pontibacter beigongshangensis]
MESREVGVTAKEMPETPVLQVQDEEGGILLSVSEPGGDLQWYRDGAPVKSATANTLAVEEAGSYYVTVTSEDGCTAASEPFSVTSLGNNYLSQATLVYPNPATSELFIQLPSQVQSGKEVQLHLYNLQGTPVAASEFNHVVDQPVNVELSVLSESMYLLRLLGEDLVIVKRVQVWGH